MTEPLRATDFHKAAGAEDWRVVSDGACAFFATASLSQSARFVQAIAAIPGIENHAPDVDVRRAGVTVRLLTLHDDYFGVTTTDLEFARKISASALALGLRADPSAIQSMLIIPGAAAIADVMPFWEAVLGYKPRPDSPAEDLVDPNDRGPAFWFENMREPRPGAGGAIHIAVWIAPELAEARVAAALAAGGHIVRDFAPSWWTLADSAGNEADISTSEARD
ncbi:MAG: VOC family protein [bacterium]